MNTNKKLEKLIEWAQEAVDHENAHYEGYDEDDVAPPSWLAELESAVNDIKNTDDVLINHTESYIGVAMPIKIGEYVLKNQKYDDINDAEDETTRLGGGKLVYVTRTLIAEEV